MKYRWLYQSTSSFPALLLYASSMILMVRSVIDLDHGVFCYPMDDPYIGLATARNVAMHGVWGVTIHGFTGTSSTHLWPILMAIVIRVIGVHDMIPLVLNAICGTALLVYSDFAMRARGAQWLLRAVALILMVLAVPLWVLSVTGMEHTLHCLLAVLFLNHSLKVLDSQPGSSAIRQESILFIITVLFCACRYESLLFVGAVALALVVRRRFKPAVLLSACGFVPIVVYGLYSIAHGSMFFPNSILMKANIHYAQNVASGNPWSGISNPFSQLGFTLVSNEWLPTLLMIYCASQISAARSRLNPVLVSIVVAITALLPGCGFFGVIGYYLNPAHRGTPYELKFSDAMITTAALACLATFILAAYTLIRRAAQSESALKLFPHIFIVGLSLHLMLARIGWWFRYEGYLIVSALFAFAVCFSDFKLNLSSLPVLKRIGVKALYAVAALVLCIELGSRTTIASQATPLACKGMFLQQYQMAQFVRTYFANDTIALNDIGAICYYADTIHLLDLMGLGSTDVAQLIHQGKFNKDAIADVSSKHKADIAIIFKNWFDVPPSWSEIGTWTVPHIVGSPEKTVTFYAIRPQSAAPLKKALEQYKPPEPVIVHVD